MRIDAVQLEVLAERQTVGDGLLVWGGALAQVHGGGRRSDGLVCGVATAYHDNHWHGVGRRPTTAVNMRGAWGGRAMGWGRIGRHMGWATAHGVRRQPTGRATAYASGVGRWPLSMGATLDQLIPNNDSDYLKRLHRQVPFVD